MIYNNKITIPNICPLTFNDISRGNDMLIYPNAFRYIQKFTFSDTIHLQFLGTEDLNISIKAHDNETGQILSTILCTSTQLTSGIYYFDGYIQCSGLNHTNYFEVYDSEDGLLFDSEPIEIGEWNDTVLIEYWNTLNAFNTVFGSYSYLTSFSIRVEGGFTPDGAKDVGEFETFNNQSLERSVTYSVPQTTETLVLGDANGLPKWMERKIYSIFHCDTISIDGVNWVREGEFTADATGLRTKILSLDMSLVENSQEQTSTGDIFLTNEDDVILTDEDINAITL